MDPLSIAASSFQIAGGIAKASAVIFEFTRDVRDADADLSRVNSELQALSSVLDPLTRALSRSPTVPDRLAAQLQSTLEGCSLVVGQISELVGKYRREGAWSKAKWAMFGSGDVDKLRESLEAYKMVLSLGLHLISASLQEDIKDDTGAIRDDTQVVRQYASEIKISTDQILARVNSIRNGRGNGGATRIEQWMEQMEVLTSYAETTYQETVLDPGEWAAGSLGGGSETPMRRSPAPEGNRTLVGQRTAHDEPAALSQDQVDRFGSIRLGDEGNGEVSGPASRHFPPTIIKSLPTIHPQSDNKPTEQLPKGPQTVIKPLPRVQSQNIIWSDHNYTAQAPRGPQETIDRLPSVYRKNIVWGDYHPTEQQQANSQTTIETLPSISSGNLPPFENYHSGQPPERSRKKRESLRRIQSNSSLRVDNSLPEQPPGGSQANKESLPSIHAPNVYWGDYNPIKRLPRNSNGNIERLPIFYPENPVREKPPPEGFDLDVLVAIDIGELSTGVSWMARHVAGSAIEQWPGGTGPRVPTSVMYNPGGDLSSWGYLCANDTGPGKPLSAGYIPLADALELSGNPPGSAPLSRLEVDQLRLHMMDFLRELCRHIKATVTSTLNRGPGSWEAMAIEFHFTLPDRIRMAEPAEVEKAMNVFKTIIWNAGFCNGERHCAILLETESEAVAMASISQESDDKGASMIIKVGESNIALAEKQPYDSPPEVMLTTSLNTKLSDTFAAEIRARAKNHTEVLVVETSPVARWAFTEQVSKALGKPQGCALTRYDAGGGSGFPGAGASGLIYRRNPWGCANRPQFGFVGANFPGLLVRMRDPSATLDVTSVWKTPARGFPLPLGDEVAFEVQTARHQRPRRANVQFDVSFTFHPRGPPVVMVPQVPRYHTGARLMCSVRTWVDVDDFETEKASMRRYSFRTTYFVNIALRLFVMDQDKAGPQFEVHVWDKRGVRIAREAEVVWYCEPPHIVWGRGYIPGGRYESIPG